MGHYPLLYLCVSVFLLDTALCQLTVSEKNVRSLHRDNLRLHPYYLLWFQTRGICLPTSIPRP